MIRDRLRPNDLTGLGIVHGLVSLFGTAVAWAVLGFDQGASFFVGAAMMGLNGTLLAWTWWRILEQKTIAWTALVIVIKYAVLLSSIWILTRTAWFHWVVAGVGISSLALSVVIWSAIFLRSE